MGCAYVQGYIDGFDQESLVRLGLDVIDAYIFQWYLDFAGSGNMTPLRDESGNILEEDGKLYYMVRYHAVIDTFPIFGISTPRMIAVRFEKYVKLGLMKKIIRNTKHGKTAFFSPTERLFELKFDRKNFEKQREPSAGSAEIPAEAEKAMSNQIDMASSQAKSIVHAHVKSISDGHVKSISHALNNPAEYRSWGSTDPAAAGSEKSQEPPKEAAAEISALRTIRDTTIRLFGTKTYTFSNDLANEIQKSCSELSLTEQETAEYLAWQYGECVKKNPKSLENFFYRTAGKSYCIERFIKARAERGRRQEAAKTTCPACGNEHEAYENCPECGLSASERSDEKAVRQRRKIHELTEDRRKSLDAELQELSKTAGTDIRMYAERKEQILQKYLPA